jgi:hypothetical protein
MKKMKKKYVFPVDLPSGMTEQKWRDYIKEGQFSGVDFRAAFDWLCHDVREGKLAQLFPLLQIVTEVRSCCWAVHADLDKKVVLKGTHATNAKFRKFSERGFRGLPATLNNMLDTRIGEWGGLEQEDARLAMGRNQIGLVFQGHTFDKSGIPQVKTLRPVTIASLDVGISHAITSSPAEWGYGAVNEDGSVVVQSSVMKKPQQIGQIGEDHIFRVQ